MQRNLTESDIDQVIMLGSSASLAKTPEKDNWVDHTGDLPRYVREVARSIHNGGGKTLSQAIAIAISRIKKWAATGKGDTKAKAAKALAEWEALKAKARSKKVAKLSAHTGQWEDCLRPVELIALSGPSFSMDKVRSAFDSQMREKRNELPWSERDRYPWVWVQEVWNTHVIVRCDDVDGKLHKVNYTVDDRGNVTFGEPIEVVVEYVEAGKDISDDDLTSALN